MIGVGDLDDPAPADEGDMPEIHDISHLQLVHRLVPFSLGTGLLCGSRPDLTPLLDSRLKFLGQRRVENDDRSGNIERPAFGSDRPTGFGLISYGPSLPTAKFEFCGSIGFP